MATTTNLLRIESLLIVACPADIIPTWMEESATSSVMGTQTHFHSIRKAIKLDVVSRFYLWPSMRETDNHGFYWSNCPSNVWNMFITTQKVAYTVRSIVISGWQLWCSWIHEDWAHILLQYKLWSVQDKAIVKPYALELHLLEQFINFRTNLCFTVIIMTRFIKNVHHDPGFLCGIKCGDGEIDQ